MQMRFRQLTTLLIVFPFIILYLLVTHHSGSTISDDCNELFRSSKQPLELVAHRENFSFLSVTTDSEHSKNNVEDPKLLEISEHPEIDIRGKFQRTQMKRLCQNYNFQHEQKYPFGDKLLEFNRHLIFDDQRKVIYCFVPKIGCTNMKRLMLYMGGHLPLSTLDWPWVEDSIYLEPALDHASLANKTLSTKEKIDRIKTYFKFMIVRNPLERLASAYRNKIEPPVKVGFENTFPEHIKIDILKMYRHSDLALWKQATKYNPLANISVSFPEFIHYFTETHDLNEHFVPSMDICHPCLLGYDFYANFKNISNDVTQLVKRFHTDPRYYHDSSLHRTDEQTKIKLASYYSLLTQRDKVKLLGQLYDELLFYYTIYPSEQHSHQTLLAIDTPIF